MKYTIIIALFLFGCAEKTKTSYEKLKDELKTDSIKKVARERVEKSVTDFFSDTTGVYKAPVQVIKYRFVQREYSSYKDVQLTYKNVSNKTISAIRFRWYGENAFGEPADMGIRDGLGGGFTDERLKAGKTSSGEWNVLSKDGKKILKAWAYEVAFEDGTIWKLKNDN